MPQVLVIQPTKIGSDKKTKIRQSSNVPSCACILNLLLNIENPFTCSEYVELLSRCESLRQWLARFVYKFLNFLKFFCIFQLKISCICHLNLWHFALFVKKGFNIWSESISPGFYHLCVRQFMSLYLFSVSCLLLCFLFLFNGLPMAGWDVKK